MWSPAFDDEPPEVSAAPKARLRLVTRSAAIKSDTAAFATVYEANHKSLYRYCRSILHDEQDAQDALQNTMTRAFAALRDESRDFELRPWLFRIAHNESVSMLRRRRVTVELEDSLPCASAVEERVAAREDLRALKRDLADLPERQRGALVLREFGGLGHREIGLALDCSPSAAQQAIADARTGLKRCREGRAMPCDAVRDALASHDGRMLRGRRLRAHLAVCGGCRDYQAALGARPRWRAVGVLPLGAFVRWAHQLLGGKALAGGGLTAGLAAQTAVTMVVVAGVVATAIEANGPSERAQPAPPPGLVGSPVRWTGVALTMSTAQANRGHAWPAAPSVGRGGATDTLARSPSGWEHGPAGGTEAGGRSKPGLEPNAESPRPGRSSESPGQSGADAGRSGESESHGGAGGSPERSGASGGRSGASRGRAGGAPGRSGASPGRSGASRGRVGGSPGRSGASPGRSGASRGRAFGSPGHSRASRDRSGVIPGQSGESPGRAGASPGRSDATRGGSGASGGADRGRSGADDPAGSRGSSPDAPPTAQGGAPAAAAPGPGSNASPGTDPGEAGRGRSDSVPGQTGASPGKGQGQSDG